MTHAAKLKPYRLPVFRATLCSLGSLLPFPDSAKCFGRLALENIHRVGVEQHIGLEDAEVQKEEKLNAEDSERFGVFRVSYLKTSIRVRVTNPNSKYS